jgi:mono/diheme cytochrome c family protein
MKKLSWPLLAGLWMLLLPPAATAGGELTTQAGVYTKDQAKSGKALYELHCGTCHDNAYFRPVLKRWHGQNLGILYNVMSTSMPESNPGGLMDAEYLDILAYIFSRSRYPAAEEPLTLEKVVTITIEDPS